MSVALAAADFLLACSSQEQIQMAWHTSGQAVAIAGLPEKCLQQVGRLLVAAADGPGVAVAAAEQVQSEGVAAVEQAIYVLAARKLEAAVVG